MASPPPPAPTPSPVQSFLSKSAGESSSPRSSEAHTSSYKTGLVASKNGHRFSYGTVSNSSSQIKPPVTVAQHTLAEGDTLQGLALKYSVEVQDIERLNSIWSTDSMYSRTIIKIPLLNDSLDSSPSGSPSLNQRHLSNMSSHSNSSDPLAENQSTRSSNDDVRAEEAEEVRSKFGPRRDRTMSCTAECGDDGVKNIMDIFNCADVQLQMSKDFAEKLAKRNAHITNLPKDAYHRTHEEEEETTSSFERESSPKSKRRLHLKRVDASPETREASRDELEEKLFEL